MTTTNHDSADSLVKSLLVRGDRLSIERGRLQLTAGSGKPVPDGWLAEKQGQLVAEILQRTGIDALHYTGYSCGHYSARKDAGITLQFDSLLTDANRFTIFNVELTRTRNSAGGKAGSLLPKGQFRLKTQSRFKPFWLSALDPPRRWSSLHDQMGKLKGILFEGEPTPGKQNKLIATSIKAINLSYPQLLKAFEVTTQPDNHPTASRQQPDNCPTKKPDNITPQPYVSRGLQPDSTTGANNYGSRNKGGAVLRESVNPLSPQKNPRDEANDAWLADYVSTEPLNHRLTTDD
ncbi:MAG: hypothetical protein V7677_19780 [Motiliproteus sp.]